MKKTEKVEVTSVNVTDEQVTVKVDATKQLSATTEPSGQKVTYAVTEGQTYASVTSTGPLKVWRKVMRPLQRLQESKLILCKLQYNLI
ncbi:phage major tail, phi13 family protein [Staphylococcus aureus]|nr:phage major tail, phi13 family protein [Staphylococcus aureus]